MKKLKEEAFYLRKQNKSFNEINQLLGVPKSTLSSWFKGDVNSEYIKGMLVKKAQERAVKQLRIMAKANKEKWQRIHLSYRNLANQEFAGLINNQFFAPGLFIYWGEGDKRLKNGVVRIANVDYRLLKIFIAFLINSCKIKLAKIRAWLLLYPDLNEKECKEYWSKVLNISEKQFVKSQYISSREKKRKTSYGVCSIQICSRELKEKIIEWINLYSNKLEEAGIAQW